MTVPNNKMKSYNNQSKQKNQANSVEYALSSNILKDPTAYILSCTPGELSVLNEILKAKLRHKIICPSYETWAEWSGFSESTVRRAMDKFEDDGIIVRHYRYKKSNLYDITNFFFLPEQRTTLSVLFRSMSIFLTLQLFAPAAAYQNHEHQLVIKDNIYISVPSVSGTPSRTSDLTWAERYWEMHRNETGPQINLLSREELDAIWSDTRRPDYAQKATQPNFEATTQEYWATENQKQEREDEP